MKPWILGWMLCLVLTFNLAPAVIAAAPDKTNAGVLENGLSKIGEEYRQQIEAILTQYRGTADANRQLKAAGASYQKTLTVPLDGLSRYTTAIGQAQVSGAYSFDAAYAALFMKKRELADCLNARIRLNETLGFALPLSEKFRQLLEDPERIRDYSTWSDAMDDLIDTLIARGLDSDQRLCIVVNTLYGTLIQGMYVVTETIAQAGYTPEMLALMAEQRHRATLFMQLLNVFRGDAIFERAVGFDSRFRLLGQVHSLMQVNRFSRRDIDDIRRLIAPERRAILAL